MQRHRRRPREMIAILALAILIESDRMPTALARSSTLVTTAVAYAHIVSLATVPGSVGNGTLFTGSVCWIGIIGSGQCFPGYDNNVSQVAFKSYTVPAGPQGRLSYRYRVDSDTDFDVTYVIVVHSGQCPVLQGPGHYAFPAGSQRDTLATYTGGVEGTDLVDLSAYAGQTVCIVVNSVSDANGSDGDCGYLSRDGLFEFDDVQVGTNLTTFDSGANGWTFGALGPIVGATQCADGVDNDGDGCADFPCDLGCTNAQDDSEAGLGCNTGPSCLVSTHVPVAGWAGGILAFALVVITRRRLRVVD